MDTLILDLRATLRTLLKAPGFTVAAVLTMACGIGVNTAVFSLLHGVLLSPLPYANPDRLAYIWKDFSANFKQGPLSAIELMDLRREAFHFEAIGGVWSVSGTLVTDGQPELLRVGRVTSNFLDVLGVRPVRGRGFTVADENGPPNMIISWGLWQRRFGGADVLGRRVRVAGGWGMGTSDYTIVGVMPQDFEILLPDPSVPRTMDAWVPFQGGWATGSGSNLRTVARLAPGASLAAAQEQVEQQGRVRPSPGRRLYAVPLHAEVVGDARPVLFVLQGAVACVLLIAGISVAGLLLVRAHGRRKEMAVRLALGAMTARLTRLLLTESVILAIAGGLLGVAFAYMGLGLLPWLDSGTLPRGHRATINGPVLAFSAVVSLASGLLFGMVPLLDVRRASLDTVLKASGRGAAGAMQERPRRVLVLAETALSVMLLVAAGLLIRTFMNLHAFNPGFSGSGVTTFRLPVPGDRYNPKLAPNFSVDLERALRTVPGIEAAGAINQLPLDDEPNVATSFWTRETYTLSDAAPLADMRIVSPGYFETVHAQLVAGRWLTADDHATAPAAVIVDDRFANRAWPGKNPIGQELLLGSREDGALVHVVGVVRHMRHHRLSEEVREQIYMTFMQRWRNQMSVVVRSSLDPESVMRAVSRRLQEIDPQLAPGQVRPLDALMARSRAKARFSMALAVLFAAVSLMLACLSLYGVISYAVAQRTHEFGVRTALGANAGHIVRLVTRQGLVLTLAGIAVGLAGSFVAVQALQRLLFGVTPFDPLTFVSVPLLVGLTGLLASYLPARRAARIDPIAALRNE